MIAEDNARRDVDSAELFGKCVLKWSNEDLAQVLRIYGDCIEAEAPVSANCISQFHQQCRPVGSL
jgi:hypothetical protein